MKVTSEGIRNFTFSKAFRGYEKEAVDQFLEALANEWQNETEKQQNLTKQLEIAEKELNRLKEVESVMLRTIKEGDENAKKLLDNAQKQSDEMISEATKNGDEYYAQKKNEGDEYWAKAENKADEIIESAENEKIRLLNEANETIASLKEEAKKEIEASEREYNSLDIAKQQLLYDLNSLLGNTNDRLTNIQTKYAPEVFNAKKIVVDQIQNAVVPEVPKPKAKKEDAKPLKGNPKAKEVKAKTVKQVEKKLVKPAKKVKLQENIDQEDDGLPTVQKILAMEEVQKNVVPHLPTVEAENGEIETEGKSFFDSI
jgi:cell division initiation protein